MVTSDHPIVHIQNLTHAYGDRIALDALSLEVQRGTLFALLGPNGSGKSTLFKILATVLTPSSGTAAIGGADVVADRLAVRRRVGIVFQSPSLDEKLTVLENLTHQGHLYGMFGRVLRQRSLTLLERFGLENRSGDYVRTLSGGLQRRVELAKSVLHAPEVLILDEPSTGLDPGARWDLMSLLEEIRREDGVTALMTTHLTEEAERCDCVAVLDHGKRIAYDSPETLKDSVGCDIVSVVASQPDDFATAVAQKFDVRTTVVDGIVRMEKPNGHEFVPPLIEAFPGRVESVTVSKPTLADVFLRLTGHRLNENEQEEAIR